MGVVAVVEVQFGFHLEYLVFEERADLFSLGDVDFELVFVYEESVVVLDLKLFELDFINFHEDKQEMVT